MGGDGVGVAMKAGGSCDLNTGANQIALQGNIGQVRMAINLAS